MGTSEEPASRVLCSQDAYHMAESLGLIQGADSGSFPSGIICMWSGTSNAIPNGWALCNGSNGTPDLRNRFIVGAGSTYDVGDTGGSNTVRLTTRNMPSHSHAGSSHSHDIYLTRVIHGNDSGRYIGLIHGDTDPTATNSLAGEARGQTESASGATGATGSDEPHENRPPYYALCFIMKL